MTSPMHRLSILALAAGALAVPNNHHDRLHARQYAYGSAPIGTGSAAPYPWHSANSTGIWAPTGTGMPTSSVSCTDEVPGSSSVAPVSSSPASQSPVSSASYTAIPPSSILSSGAISYPSSSPVAPTSYGSGNGGSGGSGGSAPTGGSSSGEDVCSTARSTVTTTTQVYVTVTATPESCGTGSSVAESSTPVSSTPAISAYTPSQVVQVSSLPSTSQAVSSSPEQQETSSSSYAVSIPALSTPAVSPASSSAAAVTTSSPAASSSPTSGSSSPSGNGKRGLAYNDASLTQCFAGNGLVTWAYNWMSSSDGNLPSGVQYIPTLHGTTSDYTNGWEQAASEAISNGAQYIFTFNEPDLAHESPAQVAAAWEQWVQPLSGKAKLGAPSVTNGVAPLGLTWLSSFLDSCSGCDIDFVNVHWYAALGEANFDAVSDFKQHLQDAHSTSGGKPVFVTEFGPSAPTTSDAVVSSFLQDVMPWMDSQDWVLGYSYFMVKDGLLVNGDEPSSYGSTYATYTG